MKLAWASCYTQYGEQYGITVEVEGDDVYEDIKLQLLHRSDEIADYGIYEED